MTTIPDSSSAAVDRDAARSLSAEVDRAGGRLQVAGSTLAALFDGERLDEPTCARIEDALGDEALTCVPPLRAGTTAGDLIEIRSTRRPDAGDDEPVIADPPPPQPVPAPDPAHALAAEAAALPASALTAGVLVPGALLTAAGLTGYWLYGLLFLVLTGGVWLLTRHARFRLARIFYFPTRSLWLTGFVLAAAPLLVASAIAAAVVVAPMASKRAADERHDRGAATLASARVALRDGDLDRARRDVAAARAQDSAVVGAGVLARAIADEQDRRDVEAARQADYDHARAALDSDDERAALALLENLEGYRDSDTLAQTARRDLAGERLAAARVAYHAGDFARARDAAADSHSILATPAATHLQSRARAALAHQRAVARAQARARARADARAAARAAAAERRRQRKLERQLEQQQQEDAAAAPVAPSVPAGNCSEIGITDFPVGPGDPRDRDGDGIGCES